MRGRKGSPSIRRELRGLERAAREATQAGAQWEATLLELAQDVFTRTRTGSRAKARAATADVSKASGNRLGSGETLRLREAKPFAEGES